jgi:hypothetical protein
MPAWTVVIQIDGSGAAAVREALSALAARLHVTLADDGPGLLTARAAGREVAEQLAAAARRLPNVGTAYIKAPETLP